MREPEQDCDFKIADPQDDAGPRIIPAPPAGTAPASYPPGLYELIVANQTEGEWSHREDLRFLREWGHRLIHELDLRAKDAQFLALPLIQIRRLRNLKTLGQYDPHPDGYRIA